MECTLGWAFCRTSTRRAAVLWNLSRCESSHGSNSDGWLRRHPEANMRGRSRNTNNKGYVEILKGNVQNSVSSGRMEIPAKGYIEIRKKARPREREQTTKTLADMKEDIEELAKTLYKLRANEKEQKRQLPEVPSEIQKEETEEEEELRLAPYVNGPVERISFTVRTPDRRLLLKAFTGIANSRTILDMLRERKVRINDIVIYDFAIVCKPMDTLDVWKRELEENPAFAVIDRYQILRIVPSSCYQYFTVHAIALKDFLIENWFPYKLPENLQNTKLKALNWKRCFIHYQKYWMPSSCLLIMKSPCNPSASYFFLFLIITAGAMPNFRRHHQPTKRSISKRYFDALSNRGFTGFDKRAFDTLSDSGFTGFDKRFEDYYLQGENGVQKRALDALMTGGFTGFDKRALAFVR